jgi:tyrosine-protein phosphatase SIW14
MANPLRLFSHWRWAASFTLVLVAVGTVYCYYRAEYNHAKRLRVVADGVLYRSGQLTGDGFREAFHRFGIKTVINLQEEARDPYVPNSFWERPTSYIDAPGTRESDICAANGVKYVSLDGGILERLDGDAGSRPPLVEDFLKVVADPKNQPVLIHCKAGLHRTGFMTAVYRMEFEGKGKAEAVRELRANGFGTFGATAGNDYLQRYILDFRPTPHDRLPKGATE